MEKVSRFKIAGKELLKGNIGNAFKSLTSSPMAINPSSYNAANGRWLFGQNGIDTFFTFDSRSSSLKAFVECAPLRAVVERKTKAYLNGKTWVLDKNGKETQTEHAKRIRLLLTRPNPIQTWAQFEAQGKIYKELFGYNIIYTIKPIGFNNSYAKSIWNLPPQFVDIIEEKNINILTVKDKKDLIQSVQLCTPDGLRTTLPKELITIHSLFTPVIESYLLPSNPIEPLTQQINNIIGAYESRNVLINYRGALGIISEDAGGGQYSSTPFEETDKEQLQKDFMSYGLRNRQWKFIMTSASIKWQQIGIPTKDLMLFEEIQDDIARICDSKDFPFELMAKQEGSTFANRAGANKSLYQDTIIPEAIYDYQQWTEFFSAEDYGLHFEKDFSHVAVLQENKKEFATARNTLSTSLDRDFKNNILTLNRVLELLDEDGIGENGNKYYYQLLAEGWVFGSKTTNNEQGQETGSGGGESNQTDQGQTN